MTEQNKTEDQQVEDKSTDTANTGDGEQNKTTGSETSAGTDINDADDSSGNLPENSNSEESDASGISSIDDDSVDSDEVDSEQAANTELAAYEAERALSVAASFESIATYIDRRPVLKRIEEYLIYQNIRTTLSGSGYKPSNVLPSLESYEQDGLFILNSAELRIKAAELKKMFPSIANNRSGGYVS